MGLAKLLLKPIEGIERPALVTVYRTSRRAKPVVLDPAPTSIATARCWCSSAVMGAVLAEEVVGIANPRVAFC